jgi:hypothetical protein
VPAIGEDDASAECAGGLPLGLPHGLR